jgi:hypothetical protein
MPPQYNAAMPTRQELHALVDTLPEGAVDLAHMFLSRLQVWPPPPPTGQVVAPGMQVRTADRKPILSSGERWEGDTLIRETMRNHWGHELKVVERIRIEGPRLIYKHAVTGPGGKRDERCALVSYRQGTALFHLWLHRRNGAVLGCASSGFERE